jgi:hypothetical protein
MNATDTVVMTHAGLWEARTERAALKASDVRVRRTPDPGEPYGESEFLVVRTAVDEHDGTVTGVEYFSAETAVEVLPPGSERLGRNLQLTHRLALEWAIAYAARKGISTVYERDETAD